MSKKESKKAIITPQSVTVAENAQTEPIALEKESISNESPQIELVNAKKETYNVSELTIRGLLDYENAARLACTKYENMIKCHDGSINYNLPNGAAFKKYNMIHSKILDEICTRLNKLVF